MSVGGICNLTIDSMQAMSFVLYMYFYAFIQSWRVPSDTIQRWDLLEIINLKRSFILWLMCEHFPILWWTYWQSRHGCIESTILKNDLDTFYEVSIECIIEVSKCNICHVQLMHKEIEWWWSPTIHLHSFYLVLHNVDHNIDVDKRRNMA